MSPRKDLINWHSHRSDPDGELSRVDTDGHGFYWQHYATADR
jgi:hypothetical protein